MHSDVLTLLAEARAAGLTVRLIGDQVEVTGPKSAMPIARRMKEVKPQIVAALRGAGLSSRLENVPEPTSRIVRTCGHCRTLPGILRPTVGGNRLFCEVCGKRKGRDQPYPWGPQ